MSYTCNSLKIKTLVSLTFKSYKEEPLRDFADKIRQNMRNDAQFTSLKTYVEEMSKRLDAYRIIALDSSAKDF